MEKSNSSGRIGGGMNEAIDMEVSNASPAASNISAAVMEEKSNDMLPSSWRERCFLVDRRPHSELIRPDAAPRRARAKMMVDFIVLMSGMCFAKLCEILLLRWKLGLLVKEKPTPSPITIS